MAAGSQGLVLQWRVRGTFLNFYDSTDEDSNECQRGSAARRAISVDTGYALMKELCDCTLGTAAIPPSRSQCTWSMVGTSGQRRKEDSDSYKECIDKDALSCNVTDTKTQEFVEVGLQASMTPAVDLSGSTLPTDSHGGTKNRCAKRHKSKGSQKPDMANATTVMIRHIGLSCMQEDAVAFLDKVGLKGKFDFLYLPMNSSRRANLGYMFVNFLRPEYLNECRQLFDGKVFGETSSLKRCEVTLAHIQGRANLTRYFHRKAISKGQYGPLLFQK